MFDAHHWWRNIRNPVRFAEAAAALIGDGFRIFVEIGPGAILHAYLADGLRAAEVEGRVLPSLSRNDGDGDPFPRIAARCYVAGYDLPAAPLFDGPADSRSVPLYPWQRQQFWLDKTVEASDPENPPFDHPLLGFRQHGPAPHWLNHLDQQLLPWIADHAVEGIPVFPAAAILEIALAAGRWRWPEAAVLEAFDVEIRRPLPFDKERMRELRTTLVSEDGDWDLASRPRLSSEPFTVHAVGRISAASDARPVLRWADCAPGGRRIDAEALYQLAQRAGLDYGPRFRTVDHVRGRCGRRRDRPSRSYARLTSPSTLICSIPLCSMVRCRDCSACWRGIVGSCRVQVFCRGASVECGWRRRLGGLRAKRGFA